MSTYKPSAKEIKQLREQANLTVSLPDCRRALEQVAGNLDAAIVHLQQLGLMPIPRISPYQRICAYPLPENMHKEQRSVAVYMLTKITMYIERGPEIYRKCDALQMPPADWSLEDLQVVEHGFRQLMDGRGFQPERPVTGVGIDGFHNMLEIIHFRMTSQRARSVDGGMLDELEYSHVMDDRTITLYNLCVYPD